MGAFYSTGQGGRNDPGADQDSDLLRRLKREASEEGGNLVLQESSIKLCDTQD